MKNDLYADAARLPEAERIDPRALLGGGPIELEIGPGRGWFMVERLIAEPSVKIVGLEIRRKWASIVDERLSKRGLGDRGRVFAGDVRSELPRFVDASLSRVFVSFPDPWWKKRHRKRLVVTPAVVGQLARVIEPGGELFLQTDVEERAIAYEAVVADEPRFVPWGASARVDTNPYGALSPRERRAIADGLPVVRLRYRRLA